MHRYFARSSLAGVLVAAVGCGGGSDAVEVHPVHGTITYQGKPMAGGGSIAFVPTGGQKGKGAGGTINEDGTYTLTTYADGDGSMVGDFRVVISQTVQKEPEPGAPGEEGSGSGEPIFVVQEGDRIPAVYTDFTGSPLNATVKAGPNQLNFDLKPQ